MPLRVRIGQASLAGVRGRNEDHVAAATPERATPKGVAFAVADGVGKGRGGGALAEAAVRAFLSGWFSSPETWSASRCLADLLEDLNRQAREQHRGAACTLTAGVVTGRTLHVSHVGDTRLWLVREGMARLLTQDHVWDNPDFRNVLHRAIGLDDSLQVQALHLELREGDRLLLCSDGIHKALDPGERLANEGVIDDLDGWCVRLANAARSGGSEDDASVMVVEVETLASLGECSLDLSDVDLPPAGPLDAGIEFDDFRLVSRLGKGRFSQVWLAEDLLRKERVVLKIPSPSLARERGFREDFLREEWIGRRIAHSNVLGVLGLEPGRRTRLYYAMPWVEGGTLRRRLDLDGPMDAFAVVRMGMEMSQALTALHRLGVLHRDIKPDNILREPTGRCLLADLGVAQIAAFGEGNGTTPGTASYMAPELFSGCAASEASEVFALGVTLYECLTRQLPWGEVEPFTRPHFGRPVPPSRWNPEIPPWLESVVMKAIEPDAENRFQVVSELEFALEQREAVARRARSGVARNPERTMRIAIAWAVVMTVVALLELVALLGGKRLR